MHEEVDGLHRSIGNFSTETEAEIFKTEMRKLGLSDAFVTEYIVGSRELNYSSSPIKTPSTPKQTGFNIAPALNKQTKTPSYSTPTTKDNFENVDNEVENTNTESSTIILNGTLPTKETEIKKEIEQNSSRIYLNGAK